jgi:YVTN family beta-propeller protein
VRALQLVLLLLAPSAHAADGTLIVLNKSEASASLIDLGSGAVVVTLPTGVGPHEAAVSPDEQLCVVANYGAQEPGNSLTVIDLAQRQVLRTIDLGEHRRPHGIVFTDRREVAVTTEHSAHLVLVDVEKGELLAAIPTQARVSHMVVVHPNLQRAFVANIGSGSISVLNLTQRAFLQELTTGKGAEAIDLSPDGKELWVGHRDDNSVAIVDPATLKTLATLPCGQVPIRAKFTPDGKHVLVSNAESGDVAVFDVAKRIEIARIPMAAGAVADKDQRLFGDRFGDSPVPVGILVHPDGKLAYVANTNADVISVIDLQKMTLVDRLVAGKEPDGMAFVGGR